ncbi:hypothetical protein AWJ20_1053 [Sugiyamaella lignohabitans]|uniref:Uncharacterized protein n=1 Tax=Sugiyamaella lignohabitans TaxID=796027 RepID=A0A167DD81_9ASCO|nr:uncharacterized protein AWJ20_1053 [Sugiyamaella lignohabitans]ANB12783.1 hypothetical protein AWJ20_1053 [Sugiyamaella lignohabitans]
MEVYPSDFLSHLTPLLVVSGLETGNSEVDIANNEAYKRVVESHPLTAHGEQLASRQVPVVVTPLAADFKSRLAAKSRVVTHWEPESFRVNRREINYLLHIEFIDRKTFKLLPTKKVVYGSDTELPAGQAPKQEFVKKYNNGDLHSAISPHNPNSQLFPDGVLSVDWIQKYLYLVPATLVSVHELGKSIAVDEDLVRVLNELKIQAQERGIKLLVVLLVEGEVTDAINDRIYNIRRSTGLAARTGLFVLPEKSQEVERETLAETICQLAYAQSQEFATTISKILRRKRGQNNILSTSEVGKLTIPPLPNVGWELRYNFKLAAMAEYRQELEVALTLYETAYDSTLELFETLSLTGQSSQPELTVQEREDEGTDKPAADRDTTPDNGTKTGISAHSSERWCQGRMLLDIIAFKIVNLCLLTEQPNVAYKKFCIHLESVATLIEKRGLSTERFSYINWRAHQFERLAEMVSWTGNSAIPKDQSMAKLSTHNEDLGGSVLRLPRSGYLFLQAYDLIKQLNEGELARDEDPYFSGDFDYNQSCLELLKQALADLEDTTGTRSTGLVYSRLADLYAKAKDYKTGLGYYKKAVAIYRKDQWPQLLIPLLEGIVLCAEEVNSVDGVAARLELMALTDSSTDTTNEKTVDIFGENTDPQPVFQLGRRQEIRMFDAGFVFESSSCYTGIGVNAQITISPLFKSPDSVTVSRLQVFVTGGGFDNNPITLIHDETLPNSQLFMLQSDKNSGETTKLKANLSFTKDVARVFQLHLVPKQLGDVEYARVLVDIKYPLFEVQQEIKQGTEDALIPVIQWAVENEPNKIAYRHIRTSPNSPPHGMQVHPRPSQVVTTSDAPSLASTGETLTVRVFVENQEDEPILLQVDGTASTDGGKAISLNWISRNSSQSEPVNNTEKSEEETSGEFHELAAASKSSQSLTLQVPNSAVNNISLELSVKYYLKSDTDKTTLIKDGALVSIPVTKPFRVNFDVAPRPHPVPWDNVFVPVL